MMTLRTLHLTPKSLWPYHVLWQLPDSASIACKPEKPLDALLQDLMKSQSQFGGYIDNVTLNCDKHLSSTTAKVTV